MNELCSSEGGIGSLANPDWQNELYRSLISASPSQRVPRHRLIRNLIRTGSFTPASDEIRVFEAELGADGPCLRYKAQIERERAISQPGILVEDRVVMLKRSLSIIEFGISKNKNDRHLLKYMAELGFDFLRLNGSWEIFDRAILLFKQASERVLDPEYTRTINQLERKADSIKAGKEAYV